MNTYTDEAFRNELQARITNQVSSLKVKMPDESTSDDIRDEIFGVTDHLELMLQEVIEENCIDRLDLEDFHFPLEEFRDIQHDAIAELEEYFDQGDGA